MRKLAFVIAAAMVPAALLAVVLIGYDTTTASAGRRFLPSEA